MERNEPIPNDMSFLYKLCLPVMNRTQITMWLRVPDFVEEIRVIKSKKVQNNELVDTSDVLSAMKGTFDGLRSQYTLDEVSQIIPINKARNSINRLERAISENPQKS